MNELLKKKREHCSVYNGKTRGWAWIKYIAKQERPSQLINLESILILLKTISQNKEAKITKGLLYVFCGKK